MSDILDPKKSGRQSSNGAMKVSNMGSGFGYLRTTLTLLTFLAGAILSMLIQNMVQSETVQFSTLGLVGFLVSISLSIAAVVSAIAAVTLGYIAQRDIRKIGEESLKLQNDVMHRTIEAIVRVETASRPLRVD